MDFLFFFFNLKKKLRRRMGEGIIFYMSVSFERKYCSKIVKCLIPVNIVQSSYSSLDQYYMEFHHNVLSLFESVLIAYVLFSSSRKTVN